MKGTWSGTYKYANQKLQAINGFPETGFTITIDAFDGEIFTGTVTDDIATGGMKGTGKITGILNGNVVRFTKQMPRESLIVNTKGDRRELDRPHPTLYYSGTLDTSGQTITGTWKFRKKLALLFAIIPIPYSLGKGTWTMQKTTD